MYMYVHVCNILVLYVCINVCMWHFLFFLIGGIGIGGHEPKTNPLYHTSVMITCVFLIFEPPQLSP